MFDLVTWLNEVAEQGRQEGADSIPIHALESLATTLDKKAKSLRFALDLDNGATLEILQHPWGDQTWIFSYRYEEMDGRDIKLLCDWKCVLRYGDERLIPDVGVTMHVIIPERMGQQYYLGVDISPGAKTFLQMEYKHDREGAPLILESITKGAATKIEIPKQEGLVQPVELPFPIVIADRIERQSHTDKDGTVHVFGDYEVPFPFKGEDDAQEVRRVSFPHKLGMI